MHTDVIVLDASAIVAACLAEHGWEEFGDEKLIAPELARSEVCSVLHEAQWRGDISRLDAMNALRRLMSARISYRTVTVIDAWAISDQLGWAKTYDAEYLALARGLECRLVTLDNRLKRRARGIVDVIGPADM